MKPITLGAKRTRTKRPLCVHGTYAGWNWHQRYEVPMCDDCLEAQRRYIAAWRKRGLVPIELPDERYSDLAGGVGLAYAHAVRESA